MSRIEAASLINSLHGTPRGAKASNHYENTHITTNQDLDTHAYLSDS
jgi:hypothetical protein